MDAEHDDISAALSNTICRDGQSTTTARIPFASGVSCAAGTTSSVAYAQANDPNTGMYFPASDQWGFVAGGTAVLTGMSSGVSVTGTCAISSTLAVTGAVTMSNTLAVTGDITHHGQPIVPIGSVVDFASDPAPNGWLLCFGQAISRTTYSALFAVLGMTYGAGDGSTTFNLPDLRGRVVAGQDDMGGSSANRLTNQSGGLNGDTLGATGGSEVHTLTTAQLAAHAHAVSDPGHTHNLTNATNVARSGGAGVQASAGSGYIASNISVDGAATGVTVGSNGSDEAHNNVQPTIILNKIIYTGVYS